MELVQDHGPVPVVAIAVGGLGIAALALNAPALPVTIIVLAAFGITVYSAERRSTWLIEEGRKKFDDESSKAAPEIQMRIRRRIVARQKAESPDLFGNEDRRK